MGSTVWRYVTARNPDDRPVLIDWKGRTNPDEVRATLEARFGPVIELEMTKNGGDDDSRD